MKPSQKIANLDMESMIAQSGEPTTLNFDDDDIVESSSALTKGEKGGLWDSEW